MFGSAAKNVNVVSKARNAITIDWRNDESPTGGFRRFGILRDGPCGGI